MGTTVFPTSTATLFQQTSAPTGWTKITTYNDYALRIVSGTGGGTGGTVAFTTAFTSYALNTTATVTSPGVSGNQNPGAIIGGAHGHPLNPAGPFSQTYNQNEPTAPTNNPGGTATPGIYSVTLTTGTTYTLSNAWNPTYAFTATVGGDGTHNHPLSFTTTTPITWTTPAFNLSVQYVDIIICTIN